MHAWICPQPTGLDSIVWQEMPTPEPGPGQVRVAIKAASLNFPDILIVQNKYQFKPEPPFVPGSEFAGTIEAVGDGVSHLKAGDRVACTGSTGGFATHAVVEAARCLPLPPAFTFEHAAAFTLTYGTSHHALVDRAQLKAGETVLILGAAGGVGTSALQISKAMGARVVAAASTDAKCERLRELGADATINYTSGNFREAIKAATDGRGPDVVYDPVGDALAEPVFRSIGWRGRYLVIGFAGGQIPSLPLNLMLLKGASVVGVFWGDYVRREPKAFAASMAEMAVWYAQGRIAPVIDTTLPMSRLQDAYARMGTRQVIGKVVLVND